MALAWQSPEALSRENVPEADAQKLSAIGHGLGYRHFTGIGVAWSTATAVMLFSGEPSTTRSE